MSRKRIVNGSEDPHMLNKSQTDPDYWKNYANFYSNCYKAMS
jgi:hypothetical protein